MAPAVGYARDGFPVGETIAATWAVGAGKLKQFGGLKYLVDGQAPAPGERFRHPALADTWELFGREGRDGIYTGPVARELVRASSAGGSGITEADLAAQHAEWAEPISLEYRGRRILEMPPNGQGIIALVALGILSFDDLGKLSPAERMHLEIEATRIGFGEAFPRVGDPRCVEVDVTSLLTESALSGLRDRIDPKTARPQPDIGRDLGDTTYLCVVDARQRRFADHQHLVGLRRRRGRREHGCGHEQPRCRGSSSIPKPEPDRPRAPPSPQHLARDGARDGRPEIVFGCMGGMMQPQGHIQLIVNVLDAGMGLQEAIDAPRYRIGRTRCDRRRRP